MASKTIVLRGREFTFAALSFYDLQRLPKRLEGLRAGVVTGDGGVSFEKFCELLLPGLEENHPGITVEELSKFVNFDNFRDALATMQEVSVPKPPPSGEALATQ